MTRVPIPERQRRISEGLKLAWRIRNGKTMPNRIQLKRTKGWRKPSGAVVVGRPSKWGNPFLPYATVPVPGWYLTGTEPFVKNISLIRVHCGSIEHCVDLFRVYSRNKARDDPNWLQFLRGKDLCCWCPLYLPCHADVLLELANR